MFFALYPLLPRRFVMATKVAGEQYYDLDGQLSEIKRQLRQPNGYPFDPEMLKRHLQAGIEGRFTGIQSIHFFKRDMSTEGLTLVGNTPRSLNSVADLDLVTFLKKDEQSISSRELIRRARLEFNANLGQEDAEWLLEHKDEIPEEYENYYLVFMGTRWSTCDGCIHVACLNYVGAQWSLDFNWLDLIHSRRTRLVRSRKS